MDEKPFQFGIADILVAMAILLLWLVLATRIGTGPGWAGTSGPPFTLAVFGGISAALYRLVGCYRRGWAIAMLAAPLLAATVLLLVALAVHKLT
ncbi:MAG TPA: hypothetical protein VG826_24840 [Pirellulales bacterium]|nr:hypothetical protein [Pirellulales bacterium]